MSLTLKELSTISSTLVKLLYKGFGPNALQTLLATSTGKLIVTSDGIQILQSMNISHPVGKMMVECVAAHHNFTGNNCKTFMIILSELLQKMEARCPANKMNIEDDAVKIRLSQGFAYFKLHLLSGVVAQIQNNSSRVCLIPVNYELVKSVFHNIILTSMLGRFPYATSKHLTNLTLDLFFGNKSDIGNFVTVLQNLIDDFELLYIEVNGMHPLSSRLLDGIVIERDFHFQSVNLSRKNSVNFVLYGSSIDEVETENSGQPIISAKNMDILHQSIVSKVDIVQKIVNLLLQNNVNLLICSEKVSDLVTHVCRGADISVIQMVPLEEMDRLAKICGIHVIGNARQLGEAYFVGKVKQCRQFITGAKKNVILQGLTKGTEYHIEKQIQICGQSPGVCQQIRFTIYNGLKNILMLVDDKRILNDNDSLTHKCVENGPSHPHAVYCQGGGYFEILLYKLLSNSVMKYQQHLPVSNAIHLLKQAILAVPLQLIKNSYRGSATENPMHIVLNMLQMDPAMGINGRSGYKLDEGDIIYEPVAGKVLLIYGLCELIEHILRLDNIVSAKKYQISKEEEL